MSHEPDLVSRDGDPNRDRKQGLGQSNGEQATHHHSRSLVLLIRLLVLALIMTALFVSAGKLGWVEGWALMILIAFGSIGTQLYLKRYNPEVLEHRKRIGEGTKTWDRIWLYLFRLIMLVMMVVAGLDAMRFGWTSMPWWLSPVGALVMSAGYLISAWAMAENPHFEGTVRIQHDRGHRVIDNGPYAVVRHPGYVGVSMLIIGSSLVLRSCWALVVVVLSVLLIGLRTWLEDSLLHKELIGYAEYARRVRSRLIPGLW